MLAADTLDSVHNSCDYFLEVEASMQSSHENDDILTVAWVSSSAGACRMGNNNNYNNNNNNLFPT